MLTTASPPKPDSTTPKIVFFGTLSLFSSIVLSELLKQNVQIAAVAIAGTDPLSTSINDLTSIGIIQAPRHDTIELVALKHSLTIIYVPDVNDPNLVTTVSQLQPDFIVVACFPYLLPKSIWQVPEFSSLNIHPSCLPAFRGPQPVFWQLKQGKTDIGISIHKLNEHFDDGALLAQDNIPIKDGMRGRAIDTLLGRQGARMATNIMQQYLRGSEPVTIEPRFPSSYQASPLPSEFELSLEWSARRAFNFMRGTQEWGRSYQLFVDDNLVALNSALAYTPGGLQKQKIVAHDHVVTIRFARGILQAYSRIPEIISA